MRPLYLEMEAFGPFNEKQVIDFEKLFDSHIFLISGSTGAGKTSIFDAITFALYNETSGQTREIKHLKSDYSDFNKTCYVEFHFENKGEIYKIIRKPEQTVLGRGGKEVVRTHEVELHIPKREPITKVAEVKEEIEKIIGLDFNRFSQIVMLPQGEFRKFLQSDGKEKQEIFREIFLTHKYDSLSKLLAERRATYKATLTSQIGIRNTFVSIIKTDDADFTKYLKKEDKDISVILDNLDKELSSDQDNYEEIKKHLEKLRKKQSNLDLKNVRSINEKIKRNEEIEKLLIQFSNEKEEYNKKENKVVLGNNALTVNNIFTQLNSRETEKKQSESQQEVTKKKLLAKKEVYDKFEKRLLKNSEREEEIEKLTKETEKNNKYLDELMNLEKTKKTQEELAIDLGKTNSRIERLNNLVKRVEIKEKLNKINLEIAEIEKITKIFENINTSYKITLEKKEEYDDIYSLYMNGQAGILAKTIKEGEPCPVCGSVDHPKKAELFLETPTEEITKQALENFNLAEKKYRKYKTEYGFSIKKFNEDHSTDLKIEDYSSVKIHYKKVTELKKQTSTDFFNQEEICLKSIKDKSFINDDEYQSMDFLLKSLLDQERKEIDIKSKIEGQGEIKKEILKNLPDDILNSSQIEKKLEDIKSKIKKNKEENQKAKEDFEKISEEVSNLSGHLSSLKIQIKKHREVIKNLREKYLDILKRLSFKDEEDFKKHLLSSEKIEELNREITDYKNKYAMLSQEKEIISKDILGKKFKDITDLEKEGEILEKDILEVQKKHSSLDVKIQSNKEQKKNIEKINKKFINEEKKYNTITSLSKLASGSGGAYISFERYVLSAYFGEIIQAANLRFSQMTMGQFKMIHREEKAGHGGASGLDLDVFNSYTGKERSINSLSGGESFMAALSLALGLCDVIQNRAGGIHIETMFIDEGFGSLDSQSLDSAITSLQNLQDGGKLIGIISHVQEIKERISTHLQVDSTQTGSSVKLVEN